MNDFPTPPKTIESAIAAQPVLLVGRRGAWLSEGTDDANDVSRQIDLAAAANRLVDMPHLTLDATAAARRLRCPPSPSLDLLELYAFVRPAASLVPTLAQLAAALGLEPPSGPLNGEADGARLLREAAAVLLQEVAAPGYRFAGGAAQTAIFLAAANWPWVPYLLRALGVDEKSVAASKEKLRHTLEPFSKLPEWEDGPPVEPPADVSISAEAVAQRLTQLVGPGAEDRPAQAAYAQASLAAFSPRENAEAPNVAFVEAGTGIGKTLGYIAPASLWAEESGGTAWLSTYTKNLQRQLDQELSRLYPDPQQKRANTVIRKGRENYLCLLNLEEALSRSLGGAQDPRDRVFIGLILRWVAYTRDGDMVGGDFPSWLGTAISWGRIAGLTDRRGECTYSACAHYRKCFIERSKRAARRAKLVVANHALVMAEALNRAGDPTGPSRFVFDEGHHLFDAADSAFAVRLSGQETIELRRWIIGAKQRREGRARGLEARIGDLLEGDEVAQGHLAEILEAVVALPSDGWLKRLGQTRPEGAAEAFLSEVRTHVYGRSGEKSGRHSLEAAPIDPSGDMLNRARELAEVLDSMLKPMAALSARLQRRLDEDADELESGQRTRIDAAARGLVRRIQTISGGWLPLLSVLGQTSAQSIEDADKFVDWFSIDRFDGRETDIGVNRHWIDPTEPFAEIMGATAHGVAVTSATLRDQSMTDDAESWASADLRLGAPHFTVPPARASFASPFDYGKQTRVLVVTDVDKHNADQVAAAYRELFFAAGGGALGIFTAIERLKGVHARIADAMDEAGLPLYGQHVDPMDTGTLVDMFRAEEDASLLGTDAVRDGVDVPGDSLRLIVFDRVPWPRPTILHRARRAHFGGRAYDEMVTRLKLKQAYGRLVRRATDRGVFVLLESGTPSRILAALPEDVAKDRVGLAEAIRMTRDFLTR